MSLNILMLTMQRILGQTKIGEPFPIHLVTLTSPENESIVVCRAPTTICPYMVVSQASFCLCSMQSFLLHLPLARHSFEPNTASPFNWSDNVGIKTRLVNYRANSGHALQTRINRENNQIVSTDTITLTKRKAQIPEGAMMNGCRNWTK